MGKATVRRKVTRKGKVNRKNKKTQRKGLNQRGGRRRPNGPGTAGGGGGGGGGGGVAPNGNNSNGENYQNHLKYVEQERNKEEANYLEEQRIKAEAIKLIEAGNLEELRALLGQRSFSDDDALMTAVTMAEPNMDIIQEVISRTEIDDDTHNKISDAIYKNPKLLTKVFDLLEEQEEHQKEGGRLANAEPNYAPSAAAAGGPPPAVAKLLASTKNALAAMPSRRTRRRL